MLHFLALLLRLALGGAGILLIYASFSRETEEGHVQSLLEEWWLRIDEMKKQAISRHLAFMKVLASVMTRLLDRLFGVRLLSVQSLGVSACYSFVWTGIALILLSR